MRKLIAENAEAKTFTYQTRLDDDAKVIAFLQDFAKLYGKIERKLYKAYAAGKNIASLKNAFMLEYGITARQFNSIRITLEGKIDSILALQGDYIKALKARIKKVIAEIKKLRRISNKTTKQANKLHQKQRLLYNLHVKLKRLENDKKNKHARICFGSKKLFKQQFNLKENNLASHEEWKKEWTKARSGQFFLIGSKDETMGNQSCIATINNDGTFNLRIRVPDALIDKHGKFIIINDVSFDYGQYEICEALTNNMTRNIYSRKAQKALNSGLYQKYGLAINYRFLRDDKGWRVFVTCAKQSNKINY